jgi:hypothetical protein
MSLLLALLLAASPASPAVDASTLTLSPPATVVELDMGKLKGDAVRLAWAPDGTQVYLQTAERDRQGNVKKTHHYLVPLNGKAPRSVNAQPAWADEYWGRKSAQSAPGLPAFKIGLSEEDKRVNTTSIPMGGDMARGAPSGEGGTSLGEGVSAGIAFQTAHVITLRLEGQVVGEFVNAPLVPGLTFGWGPDDSGLVVFATPEGKIVVMDNEGRKQEIGSKEATLPGWSVDGRHVAYLEKAGRKKMALRVVDVTGMTP